MSGQGYFPALKASLMHTSAAGQTFCEMLAMANLHPYQMADPRFVWKTLLAFLNLVE